jgi:hypothetical protein
MPRIPYDSTNFPDSFSNVNGVGELVVSWSALLWAAITVGRRELLHVLRHGEFSTFEIAYRAAILFANLCDNGAGYLRRSDAYDGLDPSEKGAVSYFLGLTTAKMFAEQQLGVPWLMHLDVYRQTLNAVIAKGARPDLVGQTDTGDWVAIEGKGRTNGFDPRALEAAKLQATHIETIDGHPPVVRAGIVTHFSDSRLHVTVDDPPPHPKSTGRLALPLNRKMLLEAYYRPFRTWLARDPRASELNVDGVVYRVGRVDAVDLTVGLERSLIDRDPDIKQIALTSDVEAGDAGRRPIAADYYAGRDGVIVVPGELWSDVNMVREPQERTTVPEAVENK